MKKQVAVLAVNPVNGFGLFQYLEAFFEHGISFNVFAVADTVSIKTNSQLSLQVDDVVANLKGHADEYDGLVFACGDAIPVFRQYANEPFNVDMLAVINEFATQGKVLAGHCAASLMFEIAGVTEGKRLAVHPLAKPAIQKGIATEEQATVDGMFYTAQSEHALKELMPRLLQVLSERKS